MRLTRRLEARSPAIPAGGIADQEADEADDEQDDADDVQHAVGQQDQQEADEQQRERGGNHLRNLRSVLPDDRLYATPSIRWDRYRWVAVVGPSQWTRYLFDRGLLGEEARWWTSSSRPRSMQAQVMGYERIGGRWPLGIKVIRTHRFVETDIDPISQFVGCLFTLYAVISIIRRR